MNLAFRTALIAALATLVGAWWGARMTYKASLVRYEALVDSTYQREWVAALRSAVAAYLGEAHLFVQGYVYSETVGADRIAIIRDLGNAKTRIRVLLDNQVTRERELNDLCNRLFSDLTNIRRFKAADAVSIMSEIAEQTEVIARKKLIRIRRPDQDA